MKKDIKTPTGMNISLMQQLLTENKLNDDNSFFLSHNIGIIEGENFFRCFPRLSKKGPFILEDYRFGMVIKGEINATLNLMPCKVTSGHMLILAKDSVVQLNSVSKDLTAVGIIISAELMTELTSEATPGILGRSSILEYNPSDKDFIQHIITSISHLVHRESYPKEPLLGLLHSAIWYFDYIYNSGERSNISSKDRNFQIFEKFIELVNSTRERNLCFYADKLHLTARYLSSVINIRSGHPAKYWIDEAVITRARILLRHSTKSVSQISDELNFPNDSFFCKFFKRLTGCTPMEFRNGDH